MKFIKNSLIIIMWRLSRESSNPKLVCYTYIRKFICNHCKREKKFQGHRMQRNDTSALNWSQHRQLKINRKINSLLWLCRSIVEFWKDLKRQKMLEHKLSILTSLNMQVEGESEGTFSFNLFGTNKSIKIDKEKFKEAITI